MTTGQLAKISASQPRKRPVEYCGDGHPGRKNGRELVAIKLNVMKADASFEAAYPEPQFGLLQNVPGLLQRLFRALAKHGLRLQDMRIERGAVTGSQPVTDFQVVCHLFNFLLTVRVRVDRVEVYYVELPREHYQKFGAAAVDALAAVQNHLGLTRFSTYAAAVGLHAALEGQAAKQYLSRFVANVPGGLGQPSGNGTVFYFGPEDDRLLSSLTLDVSGLVQDALFVRPQAVWDATRVDTASLPTRVEKFVSDALTALDLELS
jgi:hypothetical protein